MAASVSRLMHSRFFLVGLCKRRRLQNKAAERRRVDDLKQRIREACRRVTPEMLQDVRATFMEQRIQLCAEHDGGHVEHLIGH